MGSYGKPTVTCHCHFIVVLLWILAPCACVVRRDAIPAGPTLEELCLEILGPVMFIPATPYENIQRSTTRASLPQLASDEPAF